MIGGISRGLVLAAAVIYSAPLIAASSVSSLTVSVEVVARTLVTLDRAPVTIEVTAADQARGYIDLPRAVVFHIRSNAANGYALAFEPMQYPFRTAEIHWGNSDATIGTDGVWMSHRSEAGTASGSLDVRLMLAPGVNAGTYAWPVQFNAISR